MPKIPVYDQQTRTPFTATSANFTGDMFGGQIGKALEGAGDALDYMARVANKAEKDLAAKRENDQWLEAQNRIMESSLEINEKINQLAEETPDKSNFADTARGVIQEYTGSLFAKDELTPTNQQRVTNMMTRTLSLPYYLKASEIETTFRINKPKEEFDRLQTNLINHVSANPQMLPAVLTSLEDQLDPYLAADLNVREAAIGDITQKLWDASVVARIREVEGVGQLRALKSELEADNGNNDYGNNMSAQQYSAALSQLEAKIDTKVNQYKTGEKTAFENELVYAGETGVLNTKRFSNEALAAIYENPEDYRQAIARRDSAVEVGQFKAGLHQMGSEALTDYVTSTLTPGAELDPATAKVDLAARNAKASAAISVIKQRSDAPATYVMQYDPATREAAEIVFSEPNATAADWQNYLTATQIAQQRIGIKGHSVELVPKEMRESLRAQFRMDPNDQNAADNVINRFDYYQQVAGDDFQKLFKEIADDSFPPELMLAANMTRPDQQPARRQLLALSGMSADDVMFPGMAADARSERQKSDKKSLMTEIASQLEDVTAYYSRRGDYAALEEITETAATLAAHYYTQSKKPKAAAARAVQDILKADVYQDGIAVPNDTRAAAYLAGAEVLLDNPEMLISQIAPIPGASYEEMLGLAEGGRATFINDDDGKGLYLRFSASNIAPNLSLARNPDGSVRLFKWSELADLSMGLSTPIRTDSVGARGSR